MHTTHCVLVTAAGILLTTGFAAAQRDAPPPANVREAMLTVIVPASDTVFAAQGEPPANAEGWRAVEQAAQTLVESGSLLTRPPLARPEKEWKALVDAMVAQAGRARDAAAKRDADTLSEIGDTLFESCDNCHDRYIAGPR